MKFVDEAAVYVAAGHGGRGCVSFRREKFVPRGGPNGGNGGKGGDVVVLASRNHRTLLDLKFNQHHRAERGAHGEGSNRTGRNGEDTVIIVPVGTVVTDTETDEIICDASRDGERYVVARGGIGGKGNAHFKSSTNQAPRYAQDGMPGEEKKIFLELKLLADVGIIGYPNVGKSTFISRMSASRPKIADYPFTTLIPNLGVVRYGDYPEFVIADIPGLIEGAHRGAGLGTRFLRHIERTSILLHLIDISRESSKGAWHDFCAINNELVNFDAAMLDKYQIIAVNKIDIPAVREVFHAEKAVFEKEGYRLLPLSAVTGEGIREIVAEIVTRLKIEDDT